MHKSTIISLAAGFGIATGMPLSEDALTQSGLEPRAAVWQPRVSSSWQIVLSEQLNINAQSPSVTPDVDVFDIDMFVHQGTSVIPSLHKLNKKVICYFSAGSYEPYRPDSSSFPSSVRGLELDGWPGEFWLDIRSPIVRSIMAARIKIASQMGCDAIDPDNVDGYQNVNGISLTAQDSIDFVKFLATEAAKYNMATGLKNALDIIPNVLSYVQFAVNEQCAQYDECSKVQPFIAAGKPVFQIAYVDASATSKRSLKDRKPEAVQASQLKSAQSLGCFVDSDDDNDFQDDSDDDDDMTPQMCQAYCSGYTYFGLEVGNTCYCSNTMTTAAKRPDNECSRRCSGDDSQTCGGRRRLQVYQVSLFAPKSTKSTVQAQRPNPTTTTTTKTKTINKSIPTLPATKTTTRCTTTSKPTATTTTKAPQTTTKKTPTTTSAANPPTGPSGSSKISCSSMKGNGGFSVVIKKLALDGWVQFCNGAIAVTSTT